MARKEKESPKRSAPAADVLGVPAKTLMEYVKFFEKNNLKELTIRERGTTISLKKDEPVTVWATPAVAQAGPVPAPAVAAATGEATAPAAASAADDDRYDKVTSPIIGTFYEAPSPGAAPFVKEGQTVSKGTPLCIIEAMKVMNRISAEFDCRIVRKVAQNGQPVKSGETLFLVERT